MDCFPVPGNIITDGGWIPQKEAATKMGAISSHNVFDESAKPEKYRETYEDITVEGSSDYAEVELNGTYLNPHMRVIEIDVTVKDVRPGEELPMMVSLSETDKDGYGYWHGTRSVTVPAHEFPTCRDVMIRRIRFEVPEDVKASDRPVVRNFRARVCANNV